MSLISFDPHKCQKDGLCVADCPLMILEQDGEGYPRPVAGADELCIDCGHCVAVCPHGALSQRFNPVGRCVPLQKELALSPDQAQQFLRARRSIRQFKDQAVPRPEMERFIAMASHAPSGHNTQPLSWLVLGGRDVGRLSDLVVAWMREQVEEQAQLAGQLHMSEVIASYEAGHDRILRRAPHLLVVHAPAQERTAPAAAVTALAYLELAASALGLGTCWAGYFTTAAGSFEPLQAELALPPGHGVFGALMVGRPQAQYHRLPIRRQPEVSWR